MEKKKSKIMNKYSDQEIIQSFFDAWADGDPDDIKSAIYSLLKRFGATNISNQTGIPRTTLYDLCKDTSNPTLDNLSLILNNFKRGRAAG